MKAYLLFLLASFLWGSSFIAGKYAFEEMDSSIVVLLRFAGASIFWIPIIYRHRKQTNWHQVWKLLPVSFLIVPATFLLQFLGLEYTTAANASAMLGAEPLVLVLTGFLFFRNSPSKYDIIGALIVLIGILMIFGGINTTHWWGTFIVMVSTFISSIWISWSKKLMEEISPILFTAITTVVGTVLLALMTPIFAKSYEIPITVNTISSILFLAIGCSVVAGWAWNKGLSMTRTNTSGLFLALEPIFGIILGVLLLGDYIGVYQIVGMILVIIPVVVSPTINAKKKMKNEKI